MLFAFFECRYRYERLLIDHNDVIQIDFRRRSVHGQKSIFQQKTFVHKKDVFLAQIVLSNPNVFSLLERSLEPFKKRVKMTYFFEFSEQF